MENGISLITCTGGRSMLLNQCKRYVERFERIPNVPVQWIVVNDQGTDSTLLDLDTDRNGMHLDLITPRHSWKPGMNTLGMNLHAAFLYVKYEYVLFIEDDDWYSPSYMKTMYEALHNSEMAGEVCSRYYNVPRRIYRNMNNTHHASLCQTGIQTSVIPFMNELIRNSAKFIDVNLWLAIKGSFLTTQNCVGIKGMPGRPGIGIGHTASLGEYGWDPDPQFAVLRQWCGADAPFYIQNFVA